MLFEDNSGAVALSQTSVMGKRTRHIHIKMCCLNDWVARGDIVLTPISTDKNVADIGTKPLAASKFKFFADKLVK